MAETSPAVPFLPAGIQLALAWLAIPAGSFLPATLRIEPADIVPGKWGAGTVAEPTTGERGTWILMGIGDVYDDGLTKALVTMGLGGRAVDWGFLQDATEIDTADVEVITGEDGGAICVILRNQRTEVTMTGIIASGTLPKRGDRIVWTGMDGLPIVARILSRQRSYAVAGWSALQIRATAWDGLP